MNRVKLPKKARRVLNIDQNLHKQIYRFCNKHGYKISWFADRVFESAIKKITVCDKGVEKTMTKFEYDLNNSIVEIHQ